jgi:hypothetical protein
MSVLSHVIGFTLILVIVVTGCQTMQSRDVEKSGFLGDYSMLKEGEGDEALLVYMKPGFDPTKYTKVLIKPVTIWVKTGSDMTEVSMEDQQMLADYFYKAIHEELKNKKEIVTESGEGVMVIQAALTQAEESTVALDVISTIVPVGLVVSSGVSLATGTGGFAGTAVAELEVMDAISGERLAAAVDKRHGGKRLRGVLKSWDDVYGAMEHWAERIGQRLSEKPQKDE